MKETVLAFGSGAKLVGVLTEPELSQQESRRPIILLLNAGLLNRVGPFRLHVILARHFADMGFSTLRLDLSGIGDSERHTDNRPRDEQHLADINDAMAALKEKTGVERFVAMGICTGADLAHKAIVKDARIVGAVCIDGYAYPTIRYRVQEYLPKLLSLSSWSHLARRMLGKNGATAQDVAVDDQLDYRWELPPKEETRADFRSLIERDARMLCVYTSGWPYNYTDQLADAFRPLRFGSAIELAYLENATHTFKVSEDRQKLTETITNWLTTTAANISFEGNQRAQ